MAGFAQSSVPAIAGTGLRMDGSAPVGGEPWAASAVGAREDAKEGASEWEEHHRMTFWSNCLTVDGGDDGGAALDRWPGPAGVPFVDRARGGGSLTPSWPSWRGWKIDSCTLTSQVADSVVTVVYRRCAGLCVHRVAKYELFS